MTSPHPPDDCYLQLHDAIIQGVLLPNERLIELDLAERFGVGRAAVRTALARLEQDGLVEREPHRGARGRAITHTEMLEILEVRSVLEGLAARHAAQKAVETDIATLRGLVKEMQQQYKNDNLSGMSQVNTKFHDTILQIARVDTLSRLLQRLHPEHVHLQYRMIFSPRRAAQSIDEHHTIVDAIAAGSAADAEAAMRHHLEQTAEALRRWHPVGQGG